MTKFSQASAVFGKLRIYDSEGHFIEVYRDQVEQLLNACLAARGQAHGCVCGGRRVEVTHEDEAFYPRTGCTTCDTWDGPPIPRKS